MNIVVEGEVLVLKEVFVDEFDDPLELANTSQGPEVIVYDTAKDTVLEAIAFPDNNGVPGEWAVNLPIPHMGLEQRTEFVAVFTFYDAEGSSHRAKQPFYVDPLQEARSTDIVVIIGRDRRFEFGLPIEFIKPIAEVPSNGSTPATPAVPGDEMRLFLYRNNEPIFSDAGIDVTSPTSNVEVVKHIGKTTISLPAVVGKTHQLEPLAFIVEYRARGAAVPKTFTFKVWAVTPSILVAASQLEDFINKARAKNVIPELDYTQADLIQYLHRGLALFNSYPPQLTTFTGMNMQGMILDGWLQCAAYYALCAQLQAEGQMAFDFSGQAVSLNVDRTPSIESALGRIEAALERIRGTKQLLAKNGINSGDGSAGGKPINGATHLGTLGIINAPTSRVFAGRRNSWFGQLV